MMRLSILLSILICATISTDCHPTQPILETGKHDSKFNMHCQCCYRLRLDNVHNANSACAMYKSLLLYEFHADFQEENRFVNSSNNVSLFCQTACGQIKWHINGREVDRESSLEGHYQVNLLYTRCSESTDPSCPHCHCQNCNDLQSSTTQTLNSTLSLTVNSSMIIDCVSEQRYTTKVCVLRKRVDIQVIPSELS